jgi:hypothetical protein
VKEEIIKQQIKERYGKIALVGKSSEGCCCPPTECCGDSDSNNERSMMMSSPLQITEKIGYDPNDLNSIPETSILGIGCGAPVKFAISEREKYMMRNSTKNVNIGCMEKDWFPTAFVPNLVDG